MNKELYFDMLHSLAVIHMDHGNPARALEICDTLLGFVEGSWGGEGEQGRGAFFFFSYPFISLNYERFAVLVGQVCW